MKRIPKFISENVRLIHKNELPKFLCMAIMLFLTTYVHSVLRISKDVLIISHLQTETISAIQVWLVVPFSTLFILLYIKLTDIFTRSQLFHLMNWFFVSYFVLFTKVLYPNTDAVTIHFSDTLVANMPTLKYVFLIITNWHYSLFYLFAQMWVNIMLSISLWQTVNHITSITESKRFYPLFGLCSQFGLMAAALFAQTFVAKGTDWQPTLNNMTFSIVIAGTLLSISIYFLGRIIGFEVLNSRENLGDIAQRHKPKLTFGEGLKLIVSSKPILLITSLLLCFNISINLIEGVWKKSVEIFFAGNANQIHHFMARVNFYISILSIVCALISVYIIRAYKWITSALITPLICSIMGTMFFLCVIFNENPYVLGIGIPTLTIAVHFGTLHNIVVRATKYTFFDATKEMAYIPLDPNLKTKGKAAAEMVGMQFGRGSGSFMQQILLTIFTSATLLDLAPTIFIIFVVIMIWWLYTTFALNRSVLRKLHIPT